MMKEGPDEGGVRFVDGFLTILKAMI